MSAKFSRPDSCIISFSLIGGLIVFLTVLSLLNISIAQLGDIPYLISVASESKVIESVLLTLGAGLNTVILLLIIGTPLAYVLARVNFRGKGFIEGLVDLPVMLPHTVAGILVYILFMRRGIIGEPLGTLGFVFEDAYPGIVAAMFFVSSPYYINTVREGFEKVPVHLENVARTLGATRFAAFRKIVLPLSVRHIFSGSVLAWGRAIGEFAAVIMIAYYPMIISTLIYYRFTTSGLKESSTIAFIIIVICFVVFAVLRLLIKRLEGYDERV